LNYKANKTNKYIYTQMYNYLEVCAGCGGLSVGLEKAGLHSHTLIEIDKTCTKTLQTNFPSTNILNEDMRKVNFKVYRGHIDVVIGGIPCQSFSIAGKREGLNNPEKGGLFFDFFRCLSEIEPSMFMIENVEGLKNINKGETLNDIVKELSKLHYDVKYKVLNSINFDVPQKRKRLIIIGTRYGVDFIWPTANDNILTMRDALKNVPRSPGVLYSEKKKKILDMVPPGGCWVNLPLTVQKEYMGKSFLSGGGKRGIARRLAWDEPSLTLTTSPCQKQTERCHPSETRPLQIREYARIQTFPDNFIFEGSIGSIYKQIGNAVPCNLGYYLGKQIIQCLDDITKQKFINKYFMINMKTIEILSAKTLIDYLKKMTKEIIFKLLNEFYQDKIRQLYEEPITIKHIDPFKQKMDMITYNLSEEEWNIQEQRRIRDKKINNKIGEIHEYILSHLPDWECCKNSTDDLIIKLHADFYKKDKSVFIELKNSFNTMNAASKKQTIAHLSEIKVKFPKSLCVIGIINGKDYKKQLNNDIWEYSGKELFKLVYNSDKYMDHCLELLDIICTNSPKKSSTKKALKEDSSDTHQKALKEYSPKKSSTKKALKEDSSDTHQKALKEYSPKKSSTKKASVKK
jgi:DNA (cytosine-5)-methyltransferase 1